MSNVEQKTRAGFVAIIGAPNAGKSTLLNLLVGQKIAIVSHKVQTTRVNMRGVLTHNQNQFIFVDTPGIYRPRENSRLLDKSMVDVAWQASGDSDVILLVMDAKSGFNNKVMDIVENLKANKKSRTPVFLAFNKVDTIEKEKILPLMQQAVDMDLFTEIFAISAKTNDGVFDMLDRFAPHIPESPYLYDEDTLTDMPMRLVAAEITREKVFHHLQQEVPYSIAVETVNFEHYDNGSIRIDQNVLVERDAHKPIVLGKGGATIKKLGQLARKDLEHMLETQVHLFLKVKVNDKWANSHNFMREIGMHDK